MPDYTTSQDIDNFMQSSDASEARTQLGLGSASTSASTDFADASHTHTSAEVTDFQTSVSSNTDVTANTSARHTHTNKATLDATEESYTTADKAKVDSALQNGDNITELANNAGYITSAPVDSVNDNTGTVVLDADDIDDASTDHKFATQAQLDKADSALQSTDIDTLAELNAVLTDANLDDATSSRTPTAHTHSLSDLTQSGATDGQIIAWNNSAGEYQPVDNTGASSSPATAETSVWIDGGAMFAESAGASAETIYGANNASDVWHVATGEALYAKIAMPPQWDGSDLDVEFIWGSSTGTATENVKWGVATQCAGDDDAWDTAYSATTQTVDDPIINNTDLHLASVTGVTPSGSPQDGDVLFVKIVRETAGATVSSDDAQLYGVRVKYQNKLLQSWYVTKMGSEADDTSGTGEKTAWIAPANGKINAVHSGSSTATSGSALTVDVQKNATTILTTKGIIADGDDSTSTGTNHALISDPTSFSTGDRISFHVDTFGGTGAKGLHTDLLISWD
jgi:hypothetical protein